MKSPLANQKSRHQRQTLRLINPVTKAQERFAHTDTYTLNDYMLARGVASIYVSGVGTFNSEGFMTSGDYQQVLAYKAVIDWLNGRARAFTSRSRQHTITADWLLVR